MMTVWYLILKAWGLVSPFLGPVVLLYGSKFLPEVNFGRLAMPLAAVAVAAFVAWQAVGVFSSPRTPSVVSVHEVEANRLRAQLEAERAAHAQARETLAARLADLEQDRIALNRLEEELESSRERSQIENPGISRDGVLPANDPWVRGKLKRR